MAKKYEVEVNGRKARVTVPETHVMVAYSGEMTDVMKDVLQDQLSPEAVAAIAAHLTEAAGKRNKVARQVAWFRRLLIEMVGADEFNRMCDERTW